MSEGDPQRTPSKKARRGIVEARAAGRCDYCRMVQRFQGALTNSNTSPPSSGGGGDQLENLAWACGSCNLSKSDRVRILDPGGDDLVAVFDPRSMT